MCHFDERTGNFDDLPSYSHRPATICRENVKENTVRFADKLSLVFEFRFERQLCG